MRYYAKVVRSEGVYQVSFPDMPTVNTFGETKKEALRNAHEALNACLECDYDFGHPLPAPKQKAGRGFYPVEVLPHVELPYRLRKLRNGRPQKVIAEKMGVSYQAYQRIETPGKCNPTLKMMERLSDVYGKHLELVLE
jgi:antitoxin HicB